MVSLNKLMVIGNLGSDPEMRYTPNGSPVTTFSVAVNHYYTSNGERKSEVEWLTAVAWNKLAESCNTYLEKGKRVFIEGRLKSSSWVGQDGATRFRNEIIASRVIFLDRKANDDAPLDASGDELPWWG
jgi:single-strand DNA-binding protein